MRLTDFESRRVDELAPATLASYKTKAGAAATAADAAGDRKTADRRFSGIVKATKKQFDQDAKGMSEGSDDTVRFEVDSENAYNHVMDQFGSVIDWDGDTMVAPRKYWGAIQELALAASGEASEEHGLAENYPKHQDLSGISTDKLKAYVAKYTSHPMSGEGAQVRRVRAELQRRAEPNFGTKDDEEENQWWIDHDMKEGMAEGLDDDEEQLHTRLVYNHGADKLKQQWERDENTPKLIANIQKLAKIKYNMTINAGTAEWIAADLVHPDILEQSMAEGSEESYIIVRTDAEGKKDVFAKFSTYEKAQNELNDLLDHPLHTKYKQKFELRRNSQQGMAEGSGLGYNVIVRGNNFSYRGLQDALTDGHPNQAKVYKNGKLLGTIGSLSQQQDVAEGLMGSHFVRRGDPEAYLEKMRKIHKTLVKGGYKPLGYVSSRALSKPYQSAHYVHSTNPDTHPDVSVDRIGNQGHILVSMKKSKPVNLPEQGMAEGTEQVYKILAVSKSNALGKKVKLNVKASSLDEVFERLAASDWYPLDINGVEVINGKRLQQGMAEGSDRIAANKQDRVEALENKLKAKGYARTKDSDGGEYQYRWTRDGAPSYVVNYRSGANGYAEFWKEQGVDEAYNFKGSFPFDVDHMGGTRGINLPSAPTKKFFTDKKQWSQTVDDINSSKYDDNSEYSGTTGRTTVSIDGREWARWSDAQEKGYIELTSMPKGTRGDFAEDDDAVAAFLARGGEIQQLKPQSGPKRSGVAFASKHIGSAGGRGNTKGKVSGLGANTGKASKPVVTAEQHMAEDALAGMKRLAGIAPAQTQTTPGQRQYRHMPTAVQPR